MSSDDNDDEIFNKKKRIRPILISVTTTYGMPFMSKNNNNNITIKKVRIRKSLQWMMQCFESDTEEHNCCCFSCQMKEKN